MLVVERRQVVEQLASGNSRRTFRAAWLGWLADGEGLLLLANAWQRSSRGPGLQGSACGALLSNRWSGSFCPWQGCCGNFWSHRSFGPIQVWFGQLLSSSCLWVMQGDDGAPRRAEGFQPAQVLQESKVLAQLAGLEAPTGRQLTKGKGEGCTASAAELQVSVELGNAEGTGGTRAAQAMGSGMGLQGIVGVGKRLAMHREELQSHGIRADATGYPDPPEYSGGDGSGLSPMASRWLKAKPKNGRGLHSRRLSHSSKSPRQLELQTAISAIEQGIRHGL